MSNALYNALSGSIPVANNPWQLLQQLKNNPVAMLQKAGLSIPDNMNDPQAILNHLVQSGQIPQTRLQQAMNAMRKR